jgi:hypothetical protein
MPPKVKLDLGLVRAAGTRTFTGQPRGKKARADLRVNKLESEDVEVEVLVPADTYSVSPSFILGMFSPSIEALGREEFLKKYDFSSWPVELRGAVDEAIERVRSGVDVLSNIALAQQ